MKNDFDFSGVLEVEDRIYKESTKREPNPFDDIFDEGQKEKPKVGRKDNFDDLLTIMQ